MYLQELLFLMQCLLGIFMMIFLHKMNQIKKQIDTITKEVSQYLTFLEEDMEEDTIIKNSESGGNKVKISKEEAQNYLIQAVLKEYFP